MLISAVLGWWVLRYVQFANAAARRFQIVILIYFVALRIFARESTAAAAAILLALSPAHFKVAADAPIHAIAAPE